MSNWRNKAAEFKSLFGTYSCLSYKNPDYRFTEEQFNFIVSNPLCIMSAGVLEWCETPQGSNFWEAEYGYIEDNGRLSEKGLQALKELSNLTVKPKKPIRWV